MSEAIEQAEAELARYAGTWRPMYDALEALLAEHKRVLADLPAVGEDTLANAIRTADGNHTMGAGALAESLLSRFTITEKEES